MSTIKFYSENVTAELDCCPSASQFRAALSGNQEADQLLLEVLWQPCDRRGFPEGPPVVVCQSQIPAIRGHRQVRRGTWILYDLRQELAERCYFRVTPIHCADAATQSPEVIRGQG